LSHNQLGEPVINYVDNTYQSTITNSKPDRPRRSSLSTLRLEELRVFSVANTGRLESTLLYGENLETNGVYTENTTIYFVDRVTKPVTGEVITRGARLHFSLVMILSTRRV
jgi:hypothetical protein